MGPAKRLSRGLMRELENVSPFLRRLGLYLKRLGSFYRILLRNCA